MIVNKGRSIWMYQLNPARGRLFQSKGLRPVPTTAANLLSLLEREGPTEGPWYVTKNFHSAKKGDQIIVRVNRGKRGEPLGIVAAGTIQHIEPAGERRGNLWITFNMRLTRRLMRFPIPLPHVRRVIPTEQSNIGNVTVYRRVINAWLNATGTKQGVRQRAVPREVAKALGSMGNDIEEIARDLRLGETERKQLIQARIGQGEFRRRILRYWKRCAVTGCGIGRLLRASHIKPWSACSNRERMDRFNGILLAPHFDAAFDGGLISFDAQGRMLLSRRLPKSEVRRLGLRANGPVPFTSRHQQYLQYHRKYVFMK